MRMLRIALAAAAVAGAAASATAGETYDWRGLYVGVHGGYGWGTFGGTRTLPGPTTTVIPDFPIAGGLFGGHIGLNLQSNHIVFGLEGDIDWTSIGGTNAPAGAGDGFSDTVTVNPMGSIRGRIGYAADNWLLYATGGLALAGVAHTVATTSGPPSTQTVNSTATGWTAGVGLGLALNPRWTANLEYRYAALTGGDAFSVARRGGSISATNAYNLAINTVRIGVSYHFDKKSP